MKKERLMLLISSLLMTIFIIFNCVYSLYFEKGKVLTKFDLIINIFFYTFSFIGSTFFSYLAKTKKDIDKYKGLIIFVSIVFFLFNIISGILGFVAASKLGKKKKRELPKLEVLNNHKWYVYVIVFVISLLIIFVLSDYLKNKVQVICSYIFLMLLVGFTFKKELVRDFKYFKMYFREYNSYVFKMYGISIVVLLILSISIRLYTGLNNATNQETLNILFKTHPIMVIFLSMIYAPFTEELLFRGIFRKFLNKKWLFILISGITFGAAHVLDDFKSVQELLFILVYSSLGCFFAATYYKTNNIFTNMYFHFLQNSFSIIALIILTFLK